MNRIKTRLASAASLSVLLLSAAILPAAAQTVQETTQPAQSDQAPPPSDLTTQATTAADSGTMQRASADMKMVLQKLQELGAKPIEELPVDKARSQPTPADAVKAVLEAQNKSTAPEPVASAKDIAIPGPAGDIPARVYTPEGEGPFPVVLYFHGGGFVIADLDTYDATPRAIANAAKAIVVSSHYRQAPEHKFPAAHEDALAAYKWVVENSGSFNGDTTKIAVMGESAGGNLAAHVARMARDQKLQTPVAQILVYPVAGTDTQTPSYENNAKAKPLSKAGMLWFFDKVIAENDDKQDPRLDINGEADLSGLPPATIVTAGIDPLRSDGMMLAEKLKQAGVKTEHRDFENVTHEFFGMGAVVPEAKTAQAFVAERLKSAFATN